MQLKPELDLCVCVNKQHVDTCDRVEGEQPSHQSAFKRAFPQAEMSRRVVSLLFRWQVVCVACARQKFASSFGGRSPLAVCFTIDTRIWRVENESALQQEVHANCRGITWQMHQLNGNNFASNQNARVKMDE